VSPGVDDSAGFPKRRGPHETRCRYVAEQSDLTPATSPRLLSLYSQSRCMLPTFQRCSQKRKGKYGYIAVNKASRFTLLRPKCRTIPHLELTSMLLLLNFFYRSASYNDSLQSIAPHSGHDLFGQRKPGNSPVQEELGRVGTSCSQQRASFCDARERTEWRSRRG
jgi:hypothetical protein